MGISETGVSMKQGKAEDALAETKDGPMVTEDRIWEMSSVPCSARDFLWDLGQITWPCSHPTASCRGL